MEFVKFKFKDIGALFKLSVGCFPTFDLKLSQSFQMQGVIQHLKLSELLDFIPYTTLNIK